jgi:WD40 repeat protein
METKGERMLGVVWLSVACHGLMLSPLSAQEPKLRATLKGHTKSVFSVVYSPDGKTLASGSYDHTIKLWEVATCKELATLKGHTRAVYSVVYSPDGKTLASGSWKVIKLWNVPRNKEQATLRGHTDIVTSVVYSHDGKVLASGGVLTQRSRSGTWPRARKRRLSMESRRKSTP